MCKLSCKCLLSSQCHELLLVYGKSIMNLSLRNLLAADEADDTAAVDVSAVCSTIGKCHRNENSFLAFATI